MGALLHFIGEHPIISIIMAGIIGDAVTDVVYICKTGYAPKFRGLKTNKEEQSE